MALFGTKTSRAAASEVVDEKIISTVKYDKPKILLIDLESSAFETLAEAGFNVKEGTFGQPYKDGLWVSATHFRATVAKLHRAGNRDR